MDLGAVAEGIFEVPGDRGRVDAEFLEEGAGESLGLFEEGEQEVLVGEFLLVLL